MYSLHNHTADGSNQRLIDSINRPKELIQYAFDLELNGIAITDHESLKAHVKASQFVQKKKELAKEGKEDVRWLDFKLIFGNEIYLCRDGLYKDNITKEDRFYHFILLAKDEFGHELLRRLSTRAFSHSFMRSKMRRVPTYYSDLEEIVVPNRGHLIASSACIGGFLGQKILKMKKENDEVARQELEAEIKEWIEYIQWIFGPRNFFLELQPSHNKEQVFVNDYLIKLAGELGMRPIITTDSHYLKKEERNVHKLFLQSKEGDREVDEFYATTYLMNEQEIHSYMDEYLPPEVVEECFANTCLIGEQIEEFWLGKPFKLPYMPSEHDKQIANSSIFRRLPGEIDHEIWEKFIHSKEPSDRVLIHRILDKCWMDIEQFGAPKSVEEIEIELRTIWLASEKQNLVWSKYFLQVADYIKIAWDEGDTIVSPGRGSGVGFYINYLIDIIQVNPLREPVKTYYWRFLNPERVSILDIDTDIQSNRRNKVIEALQSHYGEDRVVRVMTERTEAAKLAIMDAARGCGVENDAAQYIASLIESDRGIQRSLHDTYYGNSEEGYEPNLTFQREVDKYPEMWEVAQRIEGLPCGCGSHAGGIIIVDEDITKTNSLIKLNSGEWVTAWDLHESEFLSNVKIDMLATLNLTRMRTCLDLLVEYGKIPKGKTLRETYENTIGVYNLERDDPKMWDMVAENKIVSLFQFETEVGRQGVALAKPRSIADLTALNSIIRLMAPEKGMETPLQKFAKFKDDHFLWEREMDEYGLTEHEKEIIRRHLTSSHGICESQEGLMSLVQEPEIAGWSLKKADGLRKSIAKKDKHLYEELTKEFYQNAEEKHLSKTITRYFWQVLVRTQVGYSFNASHTLAYSLVGLQNMNLAYRFPLIYWNTANLIVDSSGLDEDEEDEELDDPKEKEKVNRTEKTVNYAKVGRAIGNFQSLGIKVVPPDINESKFTFAPDEEHNAIIYGLRGITGLSIEVSREIIKYRPYHSVQDLISLVKLKKPAIINLIKCGAFDKCEKRPRAEILHDYIDSIADKKSTVNLRNMNMLINYELIPDDQAFYAQLFLLNKELKNQKYIPTEEMINFIENCDRLNFDDLMDDDDSINAAKWDKIYKKIMKEMAAYLKENQEVVLEQLNQCLFDEAAEKYMIGNESKWEMESVCYYYGKHELDFSNESFDDFSSLSPDPAVEKSFFGRDGRMIPIYQLFRIGGTVLGKNKLKNSITLLTQTGVVNVKIYKELFSHFDKQISAVDEEGKKKIIERSWFKRGTLLSISGIRRGDDFVLRSRKNSPFPAIAKIVNIRNGFLEYQFERAKGAEEEEIEDDMDDRTI